MTYTKRAIAAAIESYKVGRWHDLVGDMDADELAEVIIGEIREQRFSK